MLHATPLVTVDKTYGWGTSPNLHAPRSAEEVDLGDIWGFRGAPSKYKEFLPEPPCSTTSPIPWP